MACIYCTLDAGYEGTIGDQYKVVFAYFVLSIPVLPTGPTISTAVSAFRPVLDGRLVCRPDWPAASPQATNHSPAAWKTAARVPPVKATTLASGLTVNCTAETSDRRQTVGEATVVKTTVVKRTAVKATVVERIAVKTNVARTTVVERGEARLKSTDADGHIHC